MEPIEIVKKIMEDINKEKLLLPHFQRDYDWKPDKQKELIASFLYDVPIGSILILENKKADMTTNMITKTIGYKKPNQSNKTTAQSYLMDGQQRLTTLKAVFDDFFKESTEDLFDKLYFNLKNRWFLKLNIFDENNDIEESRLKIILDLIKNEEISDNRSLSDVKELITQKKITKKRTQDPFHPDKIKNKPEDFRHYLQKNQFLPLFLIFSTIERSSPLARKYKELLTEPTEKIFKEKWFEEVRKKQKNKKRFIKILKEYDISIDLENSEEIKKESKQWAGYIYDTLRHFLTEKRKLSIITYGDSFSKAVEAFTAMNKGGVPLSTFDIIVAKYAALSHEKLLKDRIEEKFKEICKKYIKLLPQIDTDKIFNHFSKDKSKDTQSFYNLYLNMLGILSVKENLPSQDCIKEKNKLSLTKDDINDQTDGAITSIALAFKFLSGYCGISKVTDVSYQLMILPIAKNLYDKYDKNKELTNQDISKIFYWYWVSIFGGRYREKQNSRSIEDIKNLFNLLENDDDKKITPIENIFKNKEYSDFESLKNQETASLKNSILQFISINSILGKYLNRFEKVVEKLQNKSFEESHLISIDDYNKKRGNINKIKRGKKHYINSVFNLAFLLKEKNRFDRSKSWHEWNQSDLKKVKILIPEKIKKLSWDDFNKKIKNADSKEMEELCESFIECRFNEIKKSVEDRLTQSKIWK